MMMATGSDLVIVKSLVDFLVNEIGETWRLKVTVRDNISSDVLIHDLFSLQLATSFSGMKCCGGRSHADIGNMWAG